jgi:hypothetical protein
MGAKKLAASATVRNIPNPFNISYLKKIDAIAVVASVKPAKVASL